MKRTGVSNRGGDVKGLYVETLTAEIFKVLADIIPDSTKESTFLKAQEKIHAIIAREYVEREDRK